MIVQTAKGKDLFGMTGGIFSTIPDPFIKEKCCHFRTCSRATNLRTGGVVSSSATDLMQRLIPHFSSLSALRFFVAITIVFGHTIGNLNQLDQDFFRKYGIASLMVFFHVLSGFTLAYIYPKLEGRTQVCGFWMARIGRIWPVHILVIALIIVCFPARYAFDEAWWWKLASNATLTQSWFPIFGNLDAFNAPAWALYLMFPFLIQRWERIWFWVLPAFFLLALSFTAFVSHLNAIPDSLLHRLKVDPAGIVYIHPCTRLFEFAVGMTLAVFWKKGVDRYRVGVWQGTLVEAFAVALVLATMVSTFAIAEALKLKFQLGAVFGAWLERMVIPLVPFALLIFVFSLNKGLVSRAISGRRLVYLGELSFAIYLIHTFLIWVIMSTPLTPARVWGSSLAFWCAVFLSSHLIYTLWEQPLRKFFRSLVPVQSDKIIPEPPPVILPLGSRWRVPALEISVLTALFSIVIWEKHFHPHLHSVDDEQAAKLVGKSLPDLRDIQFGDGVVLEGLLYKWADAGLQLQLVWRSLKDQRLDQVVAVHCVSPEAKLLGGADYPQEINKSMVSAGDRWVDTVMLRENKLKGATCIGLGIYPLGGALLPVDRGQRDWNGRRLLVDLTSFPRPVEAD
jgi:peptidoglycan/LPS O-acetylase OafA/YrhL